MFTLILSSLMFIVWVLICWRMIVPLPVKRCYKVLLMVLLGCALLLYHIARVLVQQGFPVELNSSLRWVGYMSLGFVSLIVPLLFTKEIVLWITSVADRLSRRKSGKTVDGKRRAFLQNAGNAAVLAAVVPTVLFSIDEAFANPAVKRVPLHVEGLHPDLEGVTIVQVSDLHVGSILDAKWLNKLVQQIEELNPDIFVVTGDAIDGQVSRVGKELVSLKGIAPRLGKFFVTGNHEFYSGVEGWVEQMRALGFTVLNNQHSLVVNGDARLLVAGVWDYYGGRFGEQYESDPLAAKAGAPAHDVSMLLAHQPKTIFKAEQVGFDIQLSGHTHGGQYFPWTYAIHLFQPYVKGLHKVGNTTLYVNTGTGFWGPPMRLTVPPEISLFTLTGSSNTVV